MVFFLIEHVQSMVCITTDTIVLDKVVLIETISNNGHVLFFFNLIVQRRVCVGLYRGSVRHNHFGWSRLGRLCTV